MQFVFLLKGQSASVPQTLSSNRLFVVASRETADRSRPARVRGKKYSAAAPAPGAPLQISGSRLRDICWEESPLSSRLSLEKDDLAFNCVMVQAPYVGRRTADANLEPMPLCVIAADSLEHIFFNVNEDLLQDGRLVLFTDAENLLHVGIDANAWAEARLAAARASVGVTGGVGSGGTGTGSNSNDPVAGGATNGVAPPLSAESGTDAGLTKRTRRGDLVSGKEEPTRSSRRLESPHRPHSPLMREQALTVVPSVVSSDDIKELNELIDEGKLSRLDVRLTDFFCCQCYHLPLLTLTMSCCGAVLCQLCAPTPPTVEAVSVADRLCPVCGEEPLDPPLSHETRDAKVAKLVKELKVLYLPQLCALRESRQAPAVPVTSPPPSFLEPNTPVLGSPG
ncbi:hypothetical protein JKF63_05905 [Porcisia hertigi]|uniref:Uncharacterized protein n=1 Tax=Porcisia hertigi TaxID=2761500 RepID=A0A836IIR1_9TRYP|nr:hypothetical protein JKF63_05905 [Porcisia hertigi]